MLKFSLALALFSLTGCGHPPTFAGIKEPDSGVLVMLGNHSTAQVAACIGQLLGVTPTSDGDAFVVQTQGPKPLTYRVHAIDDRDGRYTTQVDQVGTPLSNEPLVSRCMLTGLVREPGDRPSA